jgi:tetratricopeptide (TPR) repeat protein
MRTIITIAIALISLTTYGQRMTLETWKKESETNKRLLPKYGHKVKTDDEKKFDNKFIEEIMSQEKFDKDPRKASNHLIQLGFNYLYRGDYKTAMYRFNQAYLLDSTNTDIYWGYGAFFSSIGYFEKAKEQYENGLSIDSTNTHLLTDYGTYFMGQYYGLELIDKENALKHLETGINYLIKSYSLDSTDQNTTFKLSVCYWIKGDCDNAWKFYDICKELGGQPITDAFTKDLKKKCNNKK